jgi:hypothetical protein
MGTVTRQEHLAHADRLIANCLDRIARRREVITTETAISLGIVGLQGRVADDRLVLEWLRPVRRQIDNFADDLFEPVLSGPLCSCISFALPQPRSSRIAAAAMRARAGALGSIMIPASVLMAVSVYDRASD